MSLRQIPLKRVAHLTVSNVDKKSAEGERHVRLCNYVDVYKNNSIDLSFDLMSATATDAQVRQFRLLPGDTVITKDSETAEDIAVPAYVAESAPDLVCGYHLAIVRPGADMHPRFLYWAMSSNFLRAQMTAAATGVTRYGLRQDAMGSALITVPDLDEQRRIADFLDAQAARIHSLIALRRQQAQLASEQTQAVLDQQVDSLMRRGCLPLKRLARGIEQGASPECDNRPAEPGEWGVLKLSAIKSGVFDGGENKALPAEVSGASRHEIKPGDLLITRANTPELVGDVAVAHEVRSRLQLCDLIYRVRLPADTSPDFIAAVLLSSRLRLLISSVARGSSASMIKLRGQDVLNLPIPCADSHEQTQLAAQRLRAQERRTAVLGALSTSEALLHERRQALITAAVTGQLDVTTARGAA
ncbi:MAG: restriction endonuclease subunit [Frankiales bacterium]|nr:restriction endonuclease subunit [Frankiales bacterium]